MQPQPHSRLRGEGGYSTFLARLAAYGADYLALMMLWGFLLLFIDPEAEARRFSALNLILTTAYYTVCHGRWGATPGKMLVALRVISIDGKPVSYFQAFLRYTPYFTLGAILLFVPGVDNALMEGASAADQLSPELRVLLTISLCWHVASVMYMLQRPDRRTLHDILAYTVVIHDKKGSHA